MTAHIAIIGAGQLGSRHLQALNRMDRPVRLSVVDPNPTALDLARKRLNEVAPNELVESVKFYQDSQKLNQNIDVAIVATNSDVRRRVIEALVSNGTVTYFILEKILFQKLQDYDDIQALLAAKKIKAWVNCPRRMWPFYKTLQNNISKSKLLEISVSGSNWGMASSSIHFIDLFSFFIDQAKYQIHTHFLDSVLLDTQREGFFEITGTMMGIFCNGTQFGISSYATNKIPLTIKIVCEDAVVNIAEESGQAWVAKQSNNWKWEEQTFIIPYQSQISQLVVQQILDTGNCDLTPFNLATRLHKPILSAFLDHFNKVTNSFSLQCPIT